MLGTENISNEGKALTFALRYLIAAVDELQGKVPRRPGGQGGGSGGGGEDAAVDELQDKVPRRVPGVGDNGSFCTGGLQRNCLSCKLRFHQTGHSAQSNTN
jgi:hypothetical protein